MVQSRLTKSSLRFLLLVLLVFLLYIPSCSSPTPVQPVQIIPPEKPLSLQLPLKEIYPGDYLIFYIENSQAGDEIKLASPLFTASPQLINYSAGKFGLQGVSYRTKPGSYPLRIIINRGGAVIWEKEELLTIKPKEFAIQHLQITARQAAQRSPKLWEKDAILIDQAKAKSIPEPLWNKEFILPVAGRVSTEYGQIRYINNVEDGRHAGLDIAAPMGTPVQAANSGIVVLAMPLNVTGKTIIIDHGANLFSAYAHLDRLIATAGRKVAKGDIIGEVGSTGFSTGPHLHWTVSTGAAFMNPWLLIDKDPLSYLHN